MFNAAALALFVTTALSQAPPANPACSVLTPAEAASVIGSGGKPIPLTAAPTGATCMVQNGDKITLDVAARTINLDVPEAELAKRRAAWKQPERRFERGYGWMFSKHIKQANEGCDFDFLETGFGAPVGEPAIY